MYRRCDWCRRTLTTATVTEIGGRTVVACQRRQCQRKIEPFCNGGRDWKQHPPPGFK